MARTKNKIALKDILKGKFLIDNKSVGIWWFILFLVFLGFLLISSAHIIDSKTVAKEKLNDRVSSLRSQYANIHRELNQRQGRSAIEAQAARDSIFPSEQQPYYLTDTLQ